MKLSLTTKVLIHLSIATSVHSYCNWNQCSGVPQGSAPAGSTNEEQEEALVYCNKNEYQCEKECGGEWCTNAFSYCSFRASCDGVIHTTEWCNAKKSNCLGACQGRFWCTNGNQVCRPAAYWRFEGKCGSEVSDSVGGFHSSANSALTSKPGKVGNGMEFQRSGPPSYMIIGKNSCGEDINTLYTDGEFSILLWAYLSTDSKPWKLLFADWGGPTAGNAVHFSFYKGYLDLSTAGPGGEYHAQGGTKINRNKWYHVAVTVKAGVVSFYLNGVSDGGGSAANPISTYKYNRKSIGAKGWGYYPFDGKLDEFAFYDCALPSDEVKDIYDESKKGKPYPTEYVL